MYTRLLTIPSAVRFTAFFGLQFQFPALTTDATHLSPWGLSMRADVTFTLLVIAKIWAVRSGLKYPYTRFGLIRMSKIIAARLVCPPYPGPIVVHMI